MTTAFLELTNTRLTEELEALLLPRLADYLQSRSDGHCMRVADLDQELMVALCHGLRRDVPRAQVFILSEQVSEGNEIAITSTKLVELRNPTPDGMLRPPLLIFIPSNLRTSAEDSFGSATFEEVVVADVYSELYEQLLVALPVPLQGLVDRNMREVLSSWPWIDIVSLVRFLLTALTNGNDNEALGATLYELGLVPDLKLFSEPARLQSRLRRNMEAVRSLTTADRSIRGRVLGLDLTDQNLQYRLMQLLLDLGVDDPRRWTRQIVLDSKYHDLTFDNWTFADERNPDKVRIYNVQTDLPTVTEDETNPRLHDLVGQQWLAPQAQRRFTISFSVDPHPTQVAGLDYFTVQMMAREDGHNETASPVGVAKKLKAWKARKFTGSVALDKLNKVEFDEEGGWYFVRI